MQSQKHLFQLDESVTYLNCAYMSPMMKSVEAAGIEGMQRKRNPFAVRPIDFFTDVEKVQQEFAKLINVRDSKRIAMLASASYGIANVAQNVPLSKGDTILMVDEQFPSNYYSWERVAQEKQATIKVVKPPETLENRGKIWNELILEAINHSTKVVAIANVHWADGTKFDLLAIRKRSREVGALLVIDGTQSVGAMPFDVQTIQPDALICAGYKWLMGPYSVAVGYFGEAFDNGTPIEESWMNRFESEQFANLVNYQSRYQPKAQRYQVGEASNFINIPMFLEALKMLNHWGISNIQDYCENITKNTVEILQSKGFIIEDSAYRGHHLIGMRMPEHLSVDAIRQQLAEAKISVSIRGNAIRIAPNVYNDEMDLEKLVSVLG
ncbi:MAG: aminotransferase class V-fold PLP-dependent enzyme [Saprospiraceae bacterium]